MCQKDSSSRTTGWNGPGGGGEKTRSTWRGQGYFPYFPASSPYVTAVGATMPLTRADGEGNLVVEEEVTCQSQKGGVITSGGGFSTFFPQPKWQKNVVKEFLSQSKVMYCINSSNSNNIERRPAVSIAMVEASRMCHWSATDIEWLWEGGGQTSMGVPVLLLCSLHSSLEVGYKCAVLVNNNDVVIEL